MYRFVALVNTKLVDTNDVSDVFLEGFVSGLMTFLLFNAFHAVPKQILRHGLVSLQIGWE